MFDLIKQALGLSTHDRLSPSGLSLACLSDTGRRRAHNEDNFLFCGEVLPQEHQSLEGVLTMQAGLDEVVVAAVFDGMGGELAGEAASFSAATCLQNRASQLTADEQAIAESFRAMQQAVRAMRAERKVSSTGTTAVVLVAQGMHAVIGNLGDSIAYLMRDGELLTLSCTHTDEELLRELGINRKPGLTQYLGMDESDAPIEPHLVSIELEVGDRLLLASDGLTDMVDERGIADALGTVADVGPLVSSLCLQALDAGGADNITIIACDVLSS